MQGEYMAKHLPQGAKIVYFEGEESHSASAARWAGFKETCLDKRPDIQLLSSAVGNWNTSDALRDMTLWLKLFPQIGLFLRPTTRIAMPETGSARERRRKASTFWQLFSGTILVREGVSKYYPYMLSIAGMFFLSIAVMFTALHLDMKYTRLEREVQILRERSIRLQEQRYSRTTHSAIVERLRERGIDLSDPSAPGEIIEN